MRTISTLIDIEEEKSSRRKKRILVFFAFLSLGLFAHGEFKEYRPTWETLRAARKAAVSISLLRTQSILNKTPYEIHFTQPNIIEVFETTSCESNGQANPNLKKMWEQKLTDFSENIQFVDRSWLEKAGAKVDAHIERFCYDPMKGAFLNSSQQQNGGIFFVHQSKLEKFTYEDTIELIFENKTGNLFIE